MRERSQQPPSISSRRNPLVSRFRDATDHTVAGTMLLDGAHLLAEALDAGIEVTDVAMAQNAAARPELAALRRRVPQTVLVTDAVIAAMSPARSPSGVVALARRPAGSEAAVFAGATPLVVVAVDVQDPGNLGALLRSAEAGGATGVIATTSGADPFGWKALRGAMGSAFRLPVARVGDGALRGGPGSDARTAPRGRRRPRRHPDVAGGPHRTARAAGRRRRQWFDDVARRRPRICR